MVETGRVEEAELDALTRELKDEMPEWLETMARYDDPDVDFDDLWGP